MSVLTRVGLADGSVYSFEYNTYCQVRTIRRYAPKDSNPVNFPGDYFERAYTTYDLPTDSSTAQTDCPRFTTRTDWAYEWNGGVTSTFEPTTPNWAWGQVTTPDGTMYKETFDTSGWQRGLTTQAETQSEGVTKKRTTLQWTQDNTSISYRLNPRVTETNVYDDAGNRRRSTINYTSYGLPSDVYEYDADATTVLRRIHTDYNLSSTYTSRRIIGLPSAQYLYDGSDNLYSKVDYRYDLGGEFLVSQGPPIRHDTANYGSGFVQGRGNLNSMRRYDVTDPENLSKVSEYKTGYNTSGSIIFRRDPNPSPIHQVTISYTDSFSDGVNRNTFALPTTVTDEDNYSSTVQYNFDFSAVTRTQDPKGAVTTRTYDAAGRPDRVTNQNNSAYTRYVYAPNQYFVQSFTTINDLDNEFYAITVFDGHDRVRATASDHPTSAGQYKAQYNAYDVMGRRVQQSNPTEIDSLWNPFGDDADGWAYSYQTYDWQGRPRISTNQDLTTKETSYEGCGCAGGQVVTLKDEGGTTSGNRRQQKIYYDVLGRAVKTEVYNWDGAGVYSTTTNSYNVRDQITNIKKQVGENGTEQNTVMTYDGHGRLKTHQLPIYLGDPQSATPYTSYEYYNDDTLKKETDPRLASATYGYNNRHLVTSITYFVPSGVAPTPNVTYDYDEAGKRKLMIESGAGRTDYFYDTLSRLEREERQFFNGGPTGLFTLRYGYNVAGKLTSLTDDRFGTGVTYNYNKAGELISVTGSGWGGGSPPQFTSTDPNNLIKYRAWGGMKQLTYGNNYSTLNINYNSRLQITQFNTLVMQGEFQYHDDGRIRFARDLQAPHFDRSYEYDHVGRLKQALSGAEARGEGPADGPYKQTYQRDVWGNLIARPINLFWGHDHSLPTNTYVNNRNQAWTYDVAGNVIDGANYDAASRKTSGHLVTSQLYDGDGRFMKRVEIHGNPPYNRTTYFVRSSVLGGNVVTEVDSSGQKQQAYVYANGELLIKQYVNVNQVSWQCQNPVTGGLREFVVGNTFGGGEYDPLGAITYYADPYLSNPSPTYENTEGNRPLYYDDANPFDPNSGCALNGMPVSCGFLLRMVESGAIQAQGPRGIPGDVIHLGLGIIVGRYGTGSHLDEEGDRVIDYKIFYGRIEQRPVAKRRGDMNQIDANYDKCKGLAPVSADLLTKNKVKNIVGISNLANVDPTLLAATNQFESYFNDKIQSNPNDGRVGNADVGPLQLNYNTWHDEPPISYLPDVFGSTPNPSWYGSDDLGPMLPYATTEFNGNVFNNMYAGGIILSQYGGTRHSSAEARSHAAGLYRTGIGPFYNSPPGKAEYKKRRDAFDKAVPGYDKFFNCLGIKPFR